MQTSKKLHPRIKINRPKELALRIGFPLKTAIEVSKTMPKHYKSRMRQIGKKERLIFQADDLLKKIHKKIEQGLLDSFEYPPEIQGGIPGRSTATNARKHVGKKALGHFDISNYYPSVKSGRIYTLFCTLGCDPETARLLTRLTTADGHLPQGFSTSPKIAALILLRLNKRLGALFKAHGLEHSFWVDDLAVSGKKSAESLSPKIAHLFGEEGFSLNNKTEFARSNQRQKVTGAIVNTQVGVPREKARALRRALFLMKKFGIEAFRKKYHPELSLAGLKDRLNGEIGYVTSLDAVRYRSFKEEWERLVPKK